MPAKKTAKKPSYNELQADLQQARRDLEQARTQAMIRQAANDYEQMRATTARRERNERDAQAIKAGFIPVDLLRDAKVVSTANGTYVEIKSSDTRVIAAIKAENTPALKYASGPRLFTNTTTFEGIL